MSFGTLRFVEPCGPVALLGDNLREEVWAALSIEPNLSDLLAEQWETAKGAWPDLSVPIERYHALLAVVLERADDALQALRSLIPADLYIICACLGECPGAYQAFDGQYFEPLRGALVKMGLDQQQIDDLVQSVRIKLFVAEAGAAPRIHDYAGGGRLAGLVQVMVTRGAIDGFRQTKRETNEDRLLELPAAVADPGLSALRQQCTQEFRAAFESALNSLSKRERTLLRMRYIDELGVDEIASLYKVHRTTASRWYSDIRSTISQETKYALRQNLAVDPTELDSIIRLVDTELNLSMDRLLRSQERLVHDKK